MRKRYLLIVFILVNTISYAQFINEFSQDTARYIDELTTIFGNQLNEEETVVFNSFLKTWDSLGHPERSQIMTISELMRHRSCRARPHYIMFIHILEEFFSENKLDYGYDEWISGYNSIMESETTSLKNIQRINEVTFLILDQLQIYQSVASIWKMRTDNFRFVFDDVIRILLEDNTLVGVSSGDSIVIHHVSGSIDPVGLLFEGSSGKITWERAGLDPEIVYAEFNDFTLIFNKIEYRVDSVIFYHKQLLDEPTNGSLHDRITQIRVPEQAVYPKFSSYQSTYQLEEVVPGIDYRGAISMQGANLVGTATGDQSAVLSIYQKDTIRVRMNAKQFLFGEKLIRSNNAEVSVYIENDSIYHPDLIMTYDIDRELMRLTKSKDFNSQGPYTNSYHRIDMTFDELSWIRTETVMNMQAALGTALGNGMFESYDFFNMESYQEMQGMDYQHPLAELWTYAEMLGGDTFAVESFASYMGKAAYVIRHQLMQFTKMGFVYFDFEEDLVTLRPKLYDYIDASLMQRDYDVIRFVSRVNSGMENAQLDLLTRDLTIKGIPTIFLSDSQNVKIIPLQNSITMKRNRDFQFGGIIDAGLFKFYGNNFFFEYDNFLVNLQNIDSLSISAKTNERDAYGSQMLTTLDNMIENITGELLIDAPFNKSGITSFPEYPIFTSRENSFVYFDEKSIQNGVYERDRFYFELDPFSIDSLDNFSREALKMEGNFVSGGILPPLEMAMSIRPDNSLGFYMTTEQDGIPLFGGKATFYDDIEMSSAGLRGYGSLDYLTSTTWSDNFLFHPDSVLTRSRRFLEREERGAVSYPYVETDVARIRYYPVDDVMRISRIEDRFKMFNDSISFAGELALKPSGLSGKGGLGFSDARFDSDIFKFQADRTLADSSGVKFRNAGTGDYTWITDDMTIDVDLGRREGNFISREDYTLINMPANIYETRLNHANWLMDRNEVMMTQTVARPENLVDIGIDSLKVYGPSYVSNHPKQDSLNFVSPVAYFNYDKNQLNAEKVPFIEVGDAYVFPHQGKVQVFEKATIKPLRSAKVLANSTARYHLLYNANLTIDSRNHFMGVADYDYVDEFDNTYTFRMNKLEVDTSIVTVGTGEVAVADSFRLSPFFDFQGQISLDASKPFLNFLGGVRLTHSCDVGKQWLKFEAEINPDSILIPIEDRMQNLALNNIYTGTFKARDSIHIYPAFLSGRKDYFDRNVTYADGFLSYDKLEQKYEIAGIEKLVDMNSEGNYLSLQTDSCVLYSEGEIDLQLDYGRVNLKTFGNAIHEIPENSLDLNLMLGMDFYFNQNALNMFGNELDSLPDLEPVDLTSDLYKLSVRNLVGNAMADKLENELGLYGSYVEIPDSMKFSLLFNEVSLNWNQDSRSYRYNGKVGIGTIGDVQVNKRVDAYMEFVERGSGDIFDIYLMIDENTWYYLAYSPGALQVLSSNRDFNAVILDTPDKERKLKSKGRLSSYIYSLSSSRRMELFLDRFLMYENEQTE
ncbi:MAG: hypothetical protein K9G38_00710 [Bacteroidales bacterium]|nr:hypothetical protein [Bacteroidales bacterium]